MTTTKKIAHNTIVQMIGKIIATLLGLLGVGLMTRYLGKEQFGWYITTISFLQFLGILIDFGMIPVTAQMLSEPRFDKKKLFQNLLTFRFVTAVLFLALAPLIALFFPYPREVKIAISFTTIAFLGISMNQVLIGLYQKKLHMHIQAIGEVLSRVVLVGGLYFLMQRGSSFLPIIGIISLASVVYTAYLWIHARKLTDVTFAFDKTIWKAIITKMWPIAISIIFNVVYLKGDIILLSLYGSQTEVGLYGAAYRVIDILAQTAMLFMGIMLPLLAYAWSRDNAKEFRVRYQQAFDTLTMLAVPMVIGTFILAEPIMLLVAGKEFAASADALRILSLAVGGVYLGAIFGHVAVSINKQKQTMWIYISNAVLTLIGYLIFIPLYGMRGAAWMTVFSELYAGFLLWQIVSRYTKAPLQLQRLRKILLSGAAMAGVITLVPHWHVFLLVVIGATTYVLTLFALGGISIKTIREVISIKSA
jgi:O-antigen/teichoic acid export membrane protein